MGGQIAIGGRFGNEVLLACQMQALSVGANYFGLTNGIVCFYGKGSDPLTTITKFGPAVPNIQCSYDCTSQDSNPDTSTSETKCGGISRMSVYRKFLFHYD